MRGVMTSDWHAGFRQYPATIDGRCAREVDVERALAAAIEHTIGAQPDVVTVAGDLCHNARPSMHALVAMQAAIRRLVSETKATVIIIPGNHEQTRTVEALTPIAILNGIERVLLVTEPRRVRFRVQRTHEVVSVDCFPFGVLGAQATHSLEPDSAADTSVLLIHAAVRSSAAPNALASFYAGPDKVDVGPCADLYDVVALGDFHAYRRLHPTRIAAYPGAIERTSSNIWDEAEPKGIVAYDTESGAMEFVEIPTRPVHDYDLGDFDLPPGAGAVEVNDVLRKMTMFERLKESITRLKVDGFPREERDQLDQGLVRQLRNTCLHFQVDLRYRETTLREVQARREHVARSLDEEAAAFLAEEPAEVRETALRFLSATEAVA